jgi:hypothetical protein
MTVWGEAPLANGGEGEGVTVVCHVLEHLREGGRKVLTVDDEF